nr:hypothetical protein [uncultured Prevotella sp.]
MEILQEALIRQRSLLRLPTKPIAFANEAYCICQRSLLRFSALYTLLKFRKFSPHALKGQNLLAQGIALGNYGSKPVAL